MVGRKQVLEERIGAAIRVEFAGLISGLETDLREFRRRSRLKEEARVALDGAEAEVKKKHFRRIELKKRFWEAHYADDAVALAEIRRKQKSLERAIKKAERYLQKARMHFARVDFDEAAAGTVLREKADAAQEKADVRVGVLQETLENALAGTWREVKGASRALREECPEPRPAAVPEETTVHEERKSA